MHKYVFSKPMAQQMLASWDLRPLLLCSDFSSLFHRNLQSAGGHQESPGVAACPPREPAEFLSDPQERYYAGESLLQVQPWSCLPTAEKPGECGEDEVGFGETLVEEEQDFPLIGKAGQQVPCCPT